MTDDQRRPGADVLERTKTTTKEPPVYRVILHNDDYTTMDFVIGILETVFHKQPAVAYRLMLQVHTQGRAICGMYPHEVAETKIATVRDQAMRHGFPLQASMEED